MIAKTFELSKGHSIAVVIWDDLITVTLPDGREHNFETEGEAADWLHDILGINLHDE